MYFSTNTGSGVHTWRQHFPDGTPEQVTFGVTEEEGIHVDPDGRSFVTSIGSRQSTVWIHDSRGDRQITSEGFAFFPNISPDGKKVYYLVRAGGARNYFLTGGLWAADLESGQRQRRLPDFQMLHYNISADGQRVVFVAADERGRTPVWLASLNGGTVPRQLTAIDSDFAYFSPPDAVVFDGGGKATSFIYRIKESRHRNCSACPAFVGSLPVLGPVTPEASIATAHRRRVTALLFVVWLGPMLFALYLMWRDPNTTAGDVVARRPGAELFRLFQVFLPPDAIRHPHPARRIGVHLLLRPQGQVASDVMTGSLVLHFGERGDIVA